MSGAPRWQRQVGGILNRISPPLESVTRRDEFAIAVGLAKTVQKTLQRGFERESRRALHFLNLPAGSDVRALRNQVASFERQLRDLAKSLEDTRAGTAPRARTRQPR